MPTLKTIRKMSNQVLTSTSWLGSEPSGLCTVKGIAQGTVISAAAEDSLPHGRLSSERKKKECADDGGREKWKPNVWHFNDSDSLRRIKCELRSQFSWFSILHSSKEVAAARNEYLVLCSCRAPSASEAFRSRVFV